MKVTYLDHMGTDLTVVNAARVSFGKKSGCKLQSVPLSFCNQQTVLPTGATLIERDEARNMLFYSELSPADKSLIGFLARGCTSGEWDNWVTQAGEDGYVWFKEDRDENQENLKAILNHIRKLPPHWTPFGHCQITLHLKVPFFVAAQIKKHQAGFVVNEVSRRYVDSDPEFYEPAVWRKRAEDKKQGSGEEATWDDPLADAVLLTGMEYAVGKYRYAIIRGVCPEQARMVLPLSTYTEFWMTGSLFGWANLFNQRSDPHAQKETQEVARQIGEIISPLYPVSWKELTK